MAINSALHASFPKATGCACRARSSGFELAVRAVLGQQITVAAARTLAHAPGRALRRADRDADRRARPPVPDAGGAGRAPAATRWASSASCASARPRSAGAGAGVLAGPARAASPAPTCRRRWRRCRRCPASATGPRNTSRCARCAGPTPSRPATSALQKALGVAVGARRGRRLAGLAAVAQLRRAARLAPTRARPGSPAAAEATARSIA